MLFLLVSCFHYRLKHGEVFPHLQWAVDFHVMQRAHEHNNRQQRWELLANNVTSICTLRNVSTALLTGGSMKTVGENCDFHRCPLSIDKNHLIATDFRRFTTPGTVFDQFARPTLSPQLSLGSLLWTPRSSIGQFFPPSLVTIPEVFAKVYSTQFPLDSKVTHCIKPGFHYRIRTSTCVSKW